MAKQLADLTCDACHSGPPPVTGEELVVLRLQIPEWELVVSDGMPQLRRDFEFDNFREALEFANRVGAAAELEGHHPELTVGWGHVTVTWWTHAIRNLHRNDFVLAARTDRLYLQHK